MVLTTLYHNSVYSLFSQAVSELVVSVSLIYSFFNFSEVNTVHDRYAIHAYWRNQVILLAISAGKLLPLKNDNYIIFISHFKIIVCSPLICGQFHKMPESI